MSGGLSHRTRIVLVTLIAFLALDAARSAFSRNAARQLADAARPGSERSADVAADWPPGSALSPDAPLGDSVYARYCEVCHGPDGNGDGPAAPAMLPRPTDLTTGLTKYRSVPAGQPVLRDDLAAAVTDGLVASGMPYFGDVLSEDEVEAVVDHMVSWSAEPGDSVPEPLTVPALTDADAASLARGRALYLDAGCAGCHGDDGRTWLTFTDARGYPVGARDLTAPWTFRGGADSDDVWLRLTTGLLPSPMPAHEARLTAEERWDIVNHLESQYRTAPWAPGGRLGGPGTDPDLYRRGEYLVRSGACGTCHTPVGEDGAYLVDDGYLSGGPDVLVDGQGTYASGNLTPHEANGLGAWTEDDIARAVREGESPTGPLNPWAMPSAYFGAYTGDDVVALARHLGTLPPVDAGPVPGAPPAPRTGVVESLARRITGMGAQSRSESGPGESGPGEPGLGESSPGASSPGEPGLGVSSPGASSPGESSPGESAPGESGLGESAPGEPGPGGSAAVEPSALVYVTASTSQSSLTKAGSVAASGLVAAQLAVLVAGAVALLVEDRRAAARGRSRHSRWWTGLALGGFGLAAIAVWLAPASASVDDSRGKALMAAEARSVPSVEATAGDSGGSEQLALAERGRYLYMISACGTCHGPDGAAGRKLSSRASFGTVWASNITPDDETGLGAWTDEEVSRAIRAGVSRDGRVMHWRAMPWDHLSNLDEEDVRALVAYLRALPPMTQPVPEARAPSADDCPELTLFLSDSDQPGCR